MLDWRRVTTNPQEFSKALENRGWSSSDTKTLVDDLQIVAKQRVQLQTKADELKAERNNVSGQVSALMRTGKKDEAQGLIQKGKDLGTEIEKIEADFSVAEAKFKDILQGVPNIPHETVVVGKSADDNKEVRRWGEPKKFSFQPKSHDEIGEAKGLIDFNRAAKVTGARHAFLRGPVAQLERALANYMMDLHRSKGYEEIVPPYIVNSDTLFGTGQLPKFKEDLFKLEGIDRFLIPTAEVPVTNLFRDEILDEAELTKKFMSFSPCFRSEAGSYGRDTKGLIRQHQFHKVEMVKFTAQETSQQELEGMVADAQAVLEGLEIPYRTVLLCTGDMGFGAQKTYDIEVWLPGSLTEGTDQRGCYREISSCSDCGDFQARRAQIRYKGKNFKGTKFVHTLNGSGLAVGRTLVAVLENYQQEDGSIEVPKALRPYMGGVEKF